jgi:hypothetical protein
MGRYHKVTDDNDKNKGSTCSYQRQFESSNKYDRPCPAEGRNVLYRATFSWISDLIDLAFKKPIEPYKDLYDVPDNMRNEEVVSAVLPVIPQKPNIFFLKSSFVAIRTP